MCTCITCAVPLMTRSRHSVYMLLFLSLISQACVAYFQERSKAQVVCFSSICFFFQFFFYCHGLLSAFSHTKIATSRAVQAHFIKIWFGTTFVGLIDLFQDLTKNGDFINLRIIKPSEFAWIYTSQTCEKVEKQQYMFMWRHSCMFVSV